MSTTMSGRPSAGTTGCGKASVLWSRRQPASTTTERQILVRVDRAIDIREGELRYQLQRKHDHPLARAPELLDVMAELEQRGLVESELCFRLTAAGRAQLSEVVDVEREG